MAWEGSTRRARLPDDWPQRVAAVRKRDGYRCRVIEEGRRCKGGADEVDHFRAGDDHSLRNLRAICIRHHRIKSAREGGQAAAARRAMMRRPQEPHPGLR